MPRAARTSASTVLLIAAMGESTAAVRRVLCLHGRGESGSAFLASPPMQRLQTACPDVQFEAIDAPLEGSRWWSYPPGTRSYSAPSYEGDAESIALVEAQLIRRRFDGLLGFSQGAMLAALVAARASLGESEVDLRFVVMCGAATPAPHDQLLTRLRDTAHSIPTLHCLSAVDRINPPESGERLALCFQNAEVFWHDAGHTVPATDVGVAHVAAFIRRN